MLIDHDVDIKSVPYTAPPCEEGKDLSHEGGEYKAFKGLAHHYVDPHTCRDHIDVQNTNWNIQMEHLVNAYLDYHTQDCDNGMPSASNEDKPIHNHTDNLSLWNTELIDIFSNFFLSLHGIYIY
ncbi:hypothetical protein DFH29DRAFT_813371 [Suillus ampliporus]|nr:hypothetical protein DFH29DRAFT_813371 [Suillus ampliporus]